MRENVEVILMSQYSLFDYFSSQGIGFPKVAKRSVGSIPKGSNKTSRKIYVHDVGEELKGAKKHLYHQSSIDWTTIEENPTIAYQKVRKKELLNDWDVKDLKSEGFSSEAAYAIKLIWAKVCERPEDTPQQRTDFIKAVGTLRALLSDARDKERLMEAIRQITEAVYQAKLGTYAHQKPELENYRFWLALGDRFKTWILGNRSTRPAYISLIQKAFHTDQGKDWNWLKSGGEKRTQRREKKVKWERLVPEEVVRQSKQESGVRRPEDLVELFGFRGIQFGQWVQDVAGRYHVLCCGHALTDLVTILDLPLKAASFYGLLGLAFGARGSGAASAHYEPDNNIMNITKIRGGGSLCHEWAHALDFNLYSVSHQYTNGRRISLSGNVPGSHLPQDVGRAFQELMNEIKEGEGVKQVVVPDPLPMEQHGYRARVAELLKQHNYNIDATMMALKQSNYRIKPRMWNDIGLMYCNMLKREGMEVPATFGIPTDESNFLLDARERGPYWRREHELFARAFESWIEDELNEKGMNNSYLVSGTRFGGPYPTNKERQNINDAFRNWWQTLHRSGILHDVQHWNR